MLFKILLFFIAILLILLNCLPIDNVMSDVEMNDNERILNIRNISGYAGVRRKKIKRQFHDKVGSEAKVRIRAYAKNCTTLSKPRGTLKLEQLADGYRIVRRMKGLAPGRHGIHVHRKGDITKGCGSAGPHYNPSKVKHGSPTDKSRHVGDLGNIKASADGIARVNITNQQSPLTGVHGAIGRTIVIHEKADDLGRGGTEDSMKKGSAGRRIACGIVGFT